MKKIIRKPRSIVWIVSALGLALFYQNCQFNAPSSEDGPSLLKTQLAPDSLTSLATNSSPGFGAGIGQIPQGGNVGPRGDGQGFEGKLAYIAKQNDFCKGEKNSFLKNVINAAERVGSNLLLTRENCQPIAPTLINEETLTSSMASPEILGIGGAPFESLGSSQAAENKSSFIVTRCAGRYVKNGVTVALVDGVVRATPIPGIEAGGKDSYRYAGQFFILRPDGIKTFKEIQNLSTPEIEKVRERHDLPLHLNLQPKCATYCEGNRRFGETTPYDPQKPSFRVELLGKKWRYPDFEKRWINGRVFVPIEGSGKSLALPAHCELAPEFLPLKGFLD